MPQVPSSPSQTPHCDPQLSPTKYTINHPPGKQTVYHIPQSPTSEATPEELTAMDAEIQTLRDGIIAAKIQEKQLKLTLTTLTSTLSTADLQSSVDALEKEKEELLGRLEILRKGDVKAVEKGEMEKVEREWLVWKRNVAVRKGFCREMFVVVSDLDRDGQVSADELWVSDPGVGLDFWGRANGFGWTGIRGTGRDA